MPGPSPTWTISSPWPWIYGRTSRATPASSRGSPESDPLAQLGELGILFLGRREQRAPGRLEPLLRPSEEHAIPAVPRGIVLGEDDPSLPARRRGVDPPGGERHRRFPDADVHARGSGGSHGSEALDFDRHRCFIAWAPG